MDPVTWFVVIGFMAGCVYMTLPGYIAPLQNQPASLYWILCVGLVVRLVYMIPDPVLEVDFYRYLWDGAVINTGYSPYLWSPDQVLSGQAPKELQVLASNAPWIVEYINYPHLTTIYPPVAEAMFALANWIKPWDITVWRLILLVFDSATVWLLYLVLRHLGRPPVWIIIYWWNPVVIFEFSNAAHMDAILLPFLVAAFLFSLKTRREYISVLCLAMASAVKLWPVLLLPTLLRSHIRPTIRFWTVISALAVFTVAATALLWPFLAQAFHDFAGLQNYGTSWERNVAIFPVMDDGVRIILDTFGLYELDGGRITRTCIGLTIVVMALVINRRNPQDGEAMARRIIIVIAALLLLGPTLYPWYYTWMVPFLAIVPSRALLAFSVVLPLYMAQFHPWIQQHPQIFTDIIVWFEQGPVLVLLLLEWRQWCNGHKGRNGSHDLPPEQDHTL